MFLCLTIVRRGLPGMGGWGKGSQLSCGDSTGPTLQIREGRSVIAQCFRSALDRGPRSPPSACRELQRDAKAPPATGGVWKKRWLETRRQGSVRAPGKWPLCPDDAWLALVFQSRWHPEMGSREDARGWAQLPQEESPRGRLDLRMRTPRLDSCPSDGGRTRAL